MLCEVPRQGGSFAPAPRGTTRRLPCSVCDWARPTPHTASVTPSAARFARVFSVRTAREECLYTHLVRHCGPEGRFVCSGTLQLRAVMALHQCDLLSDGPSGRCHAPVDCESMENTGCSSRRPIRGSCAKTSAPVSWVPDRERLLRPRLRRRLPQIPDEDGGVACT